jgi:hypothetical protein
MVTVVRRSMAQYFCIRCGVDMLSSAARRICYAAEDVTAYRLTTDCYCCAATCDRVLRSQHSMFVVNIVLSLSMI